MTEGSLSILIVEDQVITRAGLRLILERIPALKVVGEAENGPAAVAKCLELKPKVVLMDMMLPEFDGLEATRRIKRDAPDTRVLMLTSYDRADDVFAALSAGADGYCLKNISANRLVQAISAISQGAVWLDPGIAKFVMEALKNAQPPLATAKSNERIKLTPKEFEVLNLVVLGNSNLEIAQKLSVSAETVKTHLHHVMEKLAVSGRTQAAVKALREGLIIGSVGGAN